MPDDKNVVAIFCGPGLLHFESASELILKRGVDKTLGKLSVADHKNYPFYLEDNGTGHTPRTI